MQNKKVCIYEDDFFFRLKVLESENMRLSATINTTNRQVDLRLNEIEQRLVDDSSQEDFSMEEEEKNQESFIWRRIIVKLSLKINLGIILIVCSDKCSMNILFNSPLKWKLQWKHSKPKFAKYKNFCVLQNYFQSARYNQDQMIVEIKNISEGELTIGNNNSDNFSCFIM